VELEDGLAVGRVAGFAGVGYDVLASVVAFGGAVPEEKTALEGFCSCLADVLEMLKGLHTY
jgi:hypothetical protein